MRVVFSAQARESVRDIALYIARDNPDRARAFVRELAGKAQQIGKMPRAYAIVPRFQHHAVRRRVVGGGQGVVQQVGLGLRRGQVLGGVERFGFRDSASCNETASFCAFAMPRCWPRLVSAWDRYTSLDRVANSSISSAAVTTRVSLRFTHATGPGYRGCRMAR